MASAPKKYVPAHGRDFEVAQWRAMDEYATSRTRDRIAYALLAAGFVSLAAAAGYGVRSGDFGGLRDVWAIAGPIAGGIVGYYFHRGRKAT